MKGGLLGWLGHYDCCFSRQVVGMCVLAWTVFIRELRSDGRNKRAPLKYYFGRIK